MRSTHWSTMGKLLVGNIRLGMEGAVHLEPELGPEKDIWTSLVDNKQSTIHIFYSYQ